MFLQHRSTQAEFMDSPGKSFHQVVDDYRQLRRANKLFFFSHPFVLTIPKLLGKDACRNLTFLDIGSGDGSLGRALTQWAARRNWSWTFTNLDLNPLALQIHPHANNVQGSALDLPFPNSHFDVVVASQMTHHLDTLEQITTHFREAWRVARHAIVLSDLHRNPFLYSLVSISTRLLRCSPEFRSDGLLSVRRGFRIPEWRSLAHSAGLPNPQVWLYAGTRIILECRKCAPASEPLAASQTTATPTSPTATHPAPA